jgi:hypothetical protein
MRLQRPITTGLSGLLMLATVLITGCQTVTTGTSLEAIGAAGACTAWPTVSYHSKKDQPDTVKSARANNRARTAYCADPPKGARK